MVAIQITFPWGRYYAHPWGLNPVRLREPEWPPSPWRLLRALASCWFRVNPGVTFSLEARELLELLGRTLPAIGIGKVAFSQTVHYQPNYGAADAADKLDARYKNTRHENHFAAVDGPVIFRWPNFELTPAQEVLLSGLLADLSYFGRAESVCVAELLTDDEVKRFTAVGWCAPTGRRKISAQCRDVFCPKSDFQVTDLWAKRGDPGLASTDAPRHLVDVLLSTDMKPDGAQWISYEMPRDWPSERVVRTPRTNRLARRPTNDGPRIAHYLKFSLQCRIPIQLRFTMPIAEQFRRAACSHYCKEFGEDQISFALFGHATDRPEDAVGEHQHAFYLPTRSLCGADSLEQPGAVSELHLWCPYGFTRAETQILLRIQRLMWKDGRYPIRPVLTAMSKEPPVDLPLATGAVMSRVWRSETPFVPPRHFYRGERSTARIREQNSPERQLMECLRKAGVDAPAEVSRLALSEARPEPLKSLPPMPLWDIVRVPNGEHTILANAVSSLTHANGSENQRPGNRQRIGFFMEVKFDREVALPMPSFGHSNHFGLGILVPFGG